MFSNVENPKQVAILTAAFDVFAAYGFKRTSMDDIAKAAGMSRPALYHSFSNKVDIYRAIVISFCSSLQADFSGVVESEKSVTEKLETVFNLAVVEPHAMMENMPHGEEIIGLKQDYAEDIFVDFDSKLSSVFETIIALSNCPKDLSNDLANMLSQSVAGMKARRMCSSQLAAGFAALLRVVAASLHAPA